MNNRLNIGSVAKASILLSILIALSGMAAIALADEDPSDDLIMPNRFSGDVLLNGAPASVGTVINAYIDGGLRGSVVVESPGEYDHLLVNGNASDDGKNVTFRVCGSTAEQNGTWNDTRYLLQMLNLDADDHVAPAVENANANPTSIVADGADTTQLTVNVTDGCQCTVGDVTVDLSAIGGDAAQEMERIGDTDVYSVTTNATEDTALGAYCLPVNASDVFGNYNTSVCIELTVADPCACGDVDTNEGLDARDVSYLAKHVAGISGYETLSGDGDVDTNEGLDARDVSYLAKHVAGISGYETLHC